MSRRPVPLLTAAALSLSVVLHAPTAFGDTPGALTDLAPVPPATALQGECGASPAANGTGYRPPRSGLGSGSAPQAGPEILHRPLATAPQLENTGPWEAQPILVSGSSAYRDGEFLYQDFLYDDRALPYPAVPETYAGNAADLVEVRLKPGRDGTLVRLTYNSMLDPQVVATTLGLGTSSEPRQMPHDGGAVMPADVFVTVHGCQGEVVRAADGSRLAAAPTKTDLLRRQVEVLIPYSAFDPRGSRAVRVGAATGLWDVARGRYQRPDPSRPAFYNVAFRDKGPWTMNTWKDESQQAALSRGDLTPLHATVDFLKLQRQVDDEMHGDPRGVPQTGPMNRILVSHFEDAQGRGDQPAAFTLSECEPPCRHMYAGRLQPYTVYVPAVPAPPSGYGLVVNLHGAGGNHNHFEPGTVMPAVSLWKMLSEAGRPSVMVQPNARGTVYFYKGMAAAEVFEVWADVAARYRLDPRHVVQSGSSMGGFGSYKLAAQYPDLYSAVFPNVSALGAAGGFGPMDPRMAEMLAGLRNVPVLATQGSMDALVPPLSTTTASAALDASGYRHDHWFFSGQEGGAGHAEYRHYVAAEYAELSRSSAPAGGDPRRVTYTVNDGFREAERYGLQADSAYWLTGVRTRAPGPTGTIDVVSQGFGSGDPEVLPPDLSAGVAHNGSQPFWRMQRRWGQAPPRAVEDVLVVRARGIAAATVDVDRARVSCDADVDLLSDGPIELTLQGRECRRVVQDAASSARATAPPAAQPAAAPVPAARSLPATGGAAGVAVLGLSALSLAGLLRRTSRT